MNITQLLVKYKWEHLNAQSKMNEAQKLSENSEHRCAKISECNGREIKLDLDRICLLKKAMNAPQKSFPRV